MQFLIRVFQLIFISLLLVTCGNPAKQKESAQTLIPKQAKSGDYLLVLRFVDNRAVVHINDSVIYDTRTVADELNYELNLTKYVDQGQSNLRVDLYNGKEPYVTADSHWRLVYDIYVNGELAEFVREEGRDGKIGLVYSESHDLEEIW